MQSRHFIDGQWTDAGHWADSFDPASCELIGRFADGWRLTSFGLATQVHRRPDAAARSKDASSTSPRGLRRCSHALLTTLFATSRASAHPAASGAQFGRRLEAPPPGQRAARCPPEIAGRGTSAIANWTYARPLRASAESAS